MSSSESPGKKKFRSVALTLATYARLQAVCAKLTTARNRGRLEARLPIRQPTYDQVISYILNLYERTQSKKREGK